MRKRFPFIGVREVRSLLGRELAERVRVEPVYIQQLRMWVGWKSNNTYELFGIDALPHNEGRPVCKRVNLFVGDVDMSDAYLIMPSMLECGK